MMTMNISTAAIISQRCSPHTTSNQKASPTEQELIVSKAAPRGIDNASSHHLPILREIPTKISQPSAANTVIVHDDNDVQHQQTIPPLSAANKTKNSSQ